MQPVEGFVLPPAESIARLEETVAEIEQRLGAEWLTTIHKFGYSGLTTKDLAELYGLLPHHDRLFQSLCFSVHGNDVASLFHFDGKTEQVSILAGGDTKHLVLNLEMASVLFAQFVHDLMRDAGLNYEPEIASLCLAIDPRPHKA